MRVLIFTEGGGKFGLGHISRCSSLYDELESRGSEVEFIIYGEVNEIRLLKNKKFRVNDWYSNDFLNHHIKEEDYCIVDSYLANENLYKTISDRAKKCLFIDDYARISYPKGIVVNPSLSVETINYTQNKFNLFLLGHNYIILRRPFVQVKRDKIDSTVKEILLTLGGSDIHNLVPKILNHFTHRYPNITFNVVGNVCEVNIVNSKNVNFFRNNSEEEILRVMLKSDLAITAAGQTVYELIATQTPFIPIKVIDNQENNVTGFKKKFVETVIEYNEPLFMEKLQTEFDKLMKQITRKEIFNKYQNVIDGLGSKRIIDALVSGEAEKDKYFLRNIKKEDIVGVFQLSNEDRVRKYSVNTKKISWNDHIVWFKNTIEANDSYFYVVTDYTDHFLGQLRYRIETDLAIISVSLTEKISGKGLSVKLLKQSIDLITEQRSNLFSIVAFIADDNISSKRLFERVGFSLTDKIDGILKYVYTISKGENK